MTLLDTTPGTNADSASSAPTGVPASAAARHGGTVATPGLRIERLGPAFGAIVHGVDLAQVDDAMAFDLRRALLAHKVLFFRGQDAFDDDAQVRLGNLLGELTAGHPVAGTHERKEIYSIDSSDPEFSFSDEWHTDVTFMTEPPAISVLRAVTLPDYGGDTSWADAQAAYDSLSEPFRGLVDQLVAAHDGNREWGAYLRKNGGQEWNGKIVTELPVVEHPVVRVHPETGRRGLFVNPGFTSHIVGVSQAESRAILDALYAHLTQPEHTIRHRWAPGDVGIWDNRATSHYANRDYVDANLGPRAMRRVTVGGDKPVGVNGLTGGAAA
ncbi:TauD/TfdA dioxygenase family protein [Dermacoccus nishinomiyaensis]